MKLTSNQFKKLVSVVSRFQVQCAEKGINERVAIMLIGGAGIGKSALTENMEGFKTTLVPIATASDPSDITGIPKVIGPESDCQTKWSRPEWVGKHKEPTIYFCDEANRGDDMTQHALMNFYRAGRLHTHQIRPCDVIVAAINPNDGKYSVGDFEMGCLALDDRFIKFEFCPTKAEWLSWMEMNLNGLMHPAILKVAEHPDIGKVADVSITINPATRRRTTVGSLILGAMTKDEIEYIGQQVCMSVWGPELGASAYQAVKTFSYAISAEEIENGKALKRVEPDKVEAYNQGLVDLAANFANLYVTQVRMKIDRKDATDREKLTAAFTAAAISDKSKKKVQNIHEFIKVINADTAYNNFLVKFGDFLQRHESNPDKLSFKTDCVVLSAMLDSVNNSKYIKEQIIDPIVKNKAAAQNVIIKCVD